MKTITLYRLENKDGRGPIIGEDKLKNYKANPLGIDNFVLFQEGDDIFQFKYACTSMKNLEYYFTKKALKKLLELGYRIVTLEIEEKLVRYAGTKKVAAWKFTDEEMFPMPEVVKAMNYPAKVLKELRDYKNSMLEMYYFEGRHLEKAYQGQMGFLSFCEDKRLKYI